MRIFLPDEASTVEMLEMTPLFSGLNKGQLKSIVRSSKERSFKKGQAIVREGESGVGFYLVVGGSAEVRRDGRALMKLARGQFFGEMGLLDQQPRSADVVALEDTDCLVLSAPTFWSLVSTNPKIGRALVQELARRLRETSRTLTE